MDGVGGLVRPKPRRRRHHFRLLSSADTGTRIRQFDKLCGCDMVRMVLESVRACKPHLRVGLVCYVPKCESHGSAIIPVKRRVPPGVSKTFSAVGCHRKYRWLAGYGVGGHFVESAFACPSHE